MNQINSKKSIFALTVSHCAGMLDAIALPIWISVLMTVYMFDSQQSGLLVTMFLIAVTISSVIFSAKFNLLRPHKWVYIGFFIAGLCFLGCTQTDTFGSLAILHFFGGFAVGMSLSLAHGTMGRSQNPHRIFGIAGIAIGIFGLLFMIGALPIIQHWGGRYLFLFLGSIMFVASAITLFLFPKKEKDAFQVTQSSALLPKTKLSSTVWLVIAGVVCLTIIQSMTFSFYERIGIAEGFGQKAVGMALIIYGIMALFPAPLATVLQYRIKPTSVICIAPILQAISVMFIAQSSNYLLYVIFGSVMIMVLIFSHTFIFGLLAQLDPTGRAAAATPAMLMFGTAIGPILGGSIVKFYGFPALGYAAIILAGIQFMLFRRASFQIYHPNKSSTSSLKST
ncbi:MFS transporter [Acinetobacter zhairhuonensis]|uniref:MFS transporter n=1 Tax=Acinetobacter sp. A7.4 TaxID=2919921 RepID=UPI001F4F5D59|nr:MFS transporter [Acinetobacter sp. A7.4]MCJ8161269.1 MFS transporter [Acinetobacter sp. A7.4]